MTSRRSNVRVGIAGWSYPDWEGVVYPAQRDFRKLRFLAQFFRSIEINSTFYRIPTSFTTEKWCKEVAAVKDFTFTVKLMRDFTHSQDLPDFTSKADVFRQSLTPMVQQFRLGALLIQFPSSFHFCAESLEYLRKLFDVFSGLPLVVEVRHGSFDTPVFFEFLREHSVGFVNIDQPPVSGALSATREVTSSNAYVRFHGRNISAWFDPNATRNERYNYSYSQDQLLDWVRRVEVISESASVVYVIFNNHFRGQEVKDALEFLHLWYEKPVRIPARLMRSFPQLERIATPDSLSEQGEFEDLPLFPQR